MVRGLGMLSGKRGERPVYRHKRRRADIRAIGETEIYEAWLAFEALFSHAVTSVVNQRNRPANIGIGPASRSSPARQLKAQSQLRFRKLPIG